MCQLPNPCTARGSRKDVPKKRRKAKKAARAAEECDATDVKASAAAVPADTAQEAAVAVSPPASPVAATDTHVAGADAANGAAGAARPAAAPKPERAVLRSSAVDGETSLVAPPYAPTADAEWGRAAPVRPRVVPAVRTGTGAMIGSVRTLSEDSEGHRRGITRQSGAVDRPRGHARSLSRISCDSTVSSGLSEQLAGGTAPDAAGEVGSDGGPLAEVRSCCCAQARAVPLPAGCELRSNARYPMNMALMLRTTSAKRSLLGVLRHSRLCWCCSRPRM